LTKLKIGRNFLAIQLSEWIECQPPLCLSLRVAPISVTSSASYRVSSIFTLLPLSSSFMKQCLSRVLRPLFSFIFITQKLVYDQFFFIFFNIENDRLYLKINIIIYNKLEQTPKKFDKLYHSTRWLKKQKDNIIENK